MRICALCKQSINGDDHHLIPLPFSRFLDGEKLDSYRIVLCQSCHRKVSRIWGKILWKLKEVLE